MDETIFHRGASAEKFVCNLLDLKLHDLWTDAYDASDFAGQLYEIKSCRLRLPYNGRYRRGSFKIKEKDLRKSDDLNLLFVVQYRSGRFEFIGRMSLGEYKQVFRGASSVSWYRMSNYIGLRDQNLDLEGPENVIVPVKRKQLKLEEFL